MVVIVMGMVVIVMVIMEVLWNAQAMHQSGGCLVGLSESAVCIIEYWQPAAPGVSECVHNVQQPTDNKLMFQ